MLRLKSKKTGKYIKADSMGMVWVFETKIEATYFLKVNKANPTDFIFEPLEELDKKKNGV
ncbi:hypothetical protein [Treponema primitia]|uniref:hypothetical protein n=1 Tax=Treponema primitia TaxID=88058 RepID=UPI00025553B3|nr:hypothetical protein [Treponema primitia]